MKSSGISEDLPDYLRSRFSTSNPNTARKISQKCIVPSLRQGVSSEAPSSFHISHVAVLDKAEKNQILSRADRSPDRFLSNLKMNKIEASKPKFQFELINKDTFDYHSIKFSQALDLIADKSPRVRKEIPYIKEYEEIKTLGFGLPRGEFTVEAMQTSVPRHRAYRIDALKEKIGMSLRRSGKIASPRDTFIHTANSCINSTRLSSISPNSPRKPMKSIRTIRTQRPLSNTTSQIDEFEKSYLKTTEPFERRQIYNFQAEDN